MADSRPAGFREHPPNTTINAINTVVPALCRFIIHPTWSCLAVLMQSPPFLLRLKINSNRLVRVLEVIHSFGLHFRSAGQVEPSHLPV